jgi:predicted adenylyl cyclase CyaB
MARNVEIKARVRDMEALESRAAASCDQGPFVIGQEDVFFNSRGGRLKLRIFPEGHGELIYYERPDARGPRTSTYHRVEIAEPHGLRELLAKAHGICGVVRKQRRLYLVGQTRVHLDRVEDLGAFMELEVVLAPGQDVEEGHHIAEELMGTLGVQKEDLIDVAYVDLLAQRNEGGGH